MNNKTYIKVNLPTEVKEHIEQKAKTVGLTMAGYLKYLATKDVADSHEKTHFLIVENLEQVSKEINRMRLRIALNKL